MNPIESFRDALTSLHKHLRLSTTVLYSLSKDIVHVASRFAHTTYPSLAAQWHQLVSWKGVIHVRSVGMVEHVPRLNQGEDGKTLLITIQFQDKPDFSRFFNERER